MNEILENLNPKQQEAVLFDKGPLLILAGAGSGKTRVLTNRIAYLIGERNVSPYSIIALTFTNKAAGEMKERVQKLVLHGAENIWVSTFHSSCVRILRRFIDTIGYGRDFVIYDTDDQKALMKEVLKYLNIDSKQLKERTVLSVISHAKDELIDEEAFEADAGGDKMQQKYAACYREYQKRLRQNNALDFDDLIFKTIQLFRMNPEALDYYRRRFTYILVDEYQDTNTAQFELIHMLASHENEYGETEHNLCVVGDDDQSIYKFRGANIRNILDFEKCYPDAKVIRLEQNYRSTGNIIAVANDVIHNNIGRKDKKLWTENAEGDSVVYNSYSNDNEEAAGTVSEIASLVREGSCEYKDFAILYRTNAQSRSFEEKLIFRNIPYRIIGGQNFYQRKEIKDMLAYLRTIDSGRDSIAVKRIINVPKRGIGLTTIDKVESYAQEKGICFYDALLQAAFIPGINRAVSKIESFVSLIEVIKSKVNNGLGLRHLIDEIVEAIAYEDYLAEEDEPDKLAERMENINELISKIAGYEDSLEETTEAPTLSGFLDEVSLVADIDSFSEDNNTVVLMTIHSAKGLEFPYVYLVGMEEGIFPGYMAISSDKPGEEIEEERRLCYVGITRAMQHLTLSSASQRMMRGELQFNRPSRFIREISRYLLKSTVSSPGASSRLTEDSLPGSIRSNISKRGNYSPDAGAFSGNKPAFGRDWTELLSKSGSSKPASGYGRGNGTSSLPASSAAEAAPDYKEGDTVRHFKFGEGRVTELIKTDKGYEVTVSFDEPFGTKRMRASVAKLETVK